MQSYKKHVLICGGTGCMSSKSQQIAEKMREVIKEKGLDKEIQVVLTGCFGFCEQGPIVKIMPENTFYVSVQLTDVERIVQEDLIECKKIETLLYTDPKTKKRIHEGKNMEFYKKQVRRALRNCGVIDPENIQEYLGSKGYQALGKVLTEMKPEDVIKVMKDSGLRGRGGGGFPTGLKWDFASRYHADQKYVVCNADEGDPGAFMDRSILEGDPNSVLEAMAICGYAMSASKGMIYIRAEYPLAVKRLQIAIKQATEIGVLGKNIFGTDFSFEIEIRYGAGAFVCGEETALIHSMEGERGEPTNKPPFPAEAGFWNKPTNVNNVETLANVSQIILNGADWFKEYGTEKSAGTKVFALAGKINNVGLVEVPMGTTLREVIFEIGGGIKNGKKFKAVQTGGPSGGCLTEADLDIPIDFDNLIACGSMMGSGGMIVMDQDDCMVAISKFYMEFIVEESCGKCTPCRIGNKRLNEILEKISEGKGTLADLDLLKHLAMTIKDTSLCGLGQTAPNPILSTLDKFWDEYVAHVVDKKCPSGVCSSLLQYNISKEKCIGCTACARACPVAAIKGKVKETHIIDQDICIKCGACFEVCKFAAVSRN